ncbi:zinc finger, CCHC-type containing protein [Tanacetum coccineum]
MPEIVLKRIQKSNLIEEDLEPTLLMATIEEHHEVFLNERNFEPPKTSPGEESLWYLDNGASNHMTGVKEHFKEIDEKIIGNIRFGEGSYIEIKGKGSILLECKNEKQRAISQGIPSIKYSTDICDMCLIGKHARAPFLYQAEYRSKTALDLIYGDLCGPISPPTPSGKRYIFLLVDDYSRYMREYFLNSKDQAFGVFKEFKTRVEKEHGTKIKTFRTDRGGEFTSNEFHKYCRENGIIRQLTAPYSPQQNGVVKRKNRTILSTTRCMMKATGMPQNFWAEAVRHAILLLNCTPTKSLEDVTPYKALKGRKPNLQHYVDDLIVTGTSKKEIESFKYQMQEQFEMSDLGGLLAYYLGIEVTQKWGEISIKQTGYATKILKDTGMLDCNDAKIPMEPGLKQD